MNDTILLFVWMTLYLVWFEVNMIDILVWFYIPRRFGSSIALGLLQDFGLQIPLRPCYVLRGAFICLSFDRLCMKRARCGCQSPKNLVGASALPTGKFLRVRKVFARFYKIGHKTKPKHQLNSE